VTETFEFPGARFRHDPSPCER